MSMCQMMTCIMQSFALVSVQKWQKKQESDSVKFCGFLKRLSWISHLVKRQHAIDANLAPQVSQNFLKVHLRRIPTYSPVGIKLY